MFNIKDNKIMNAQGKQTKHLVERIKHDERFAYDFFYGSSRIPGKSIAPIRERLVYQLRKSYHIDIEPYIISTAIYEHLWSEGSWKNLNNYTFRSSFFYWLSTVASHAVMKFLTDNAYINVSPSRTAGNTRLSLKKKSPEYCKMVIDDMVHTPQMNDFLTALYVDHLQQEEIQKKFNLEEDDYKLLWKSSEKTLKTALLTTSNYYDDVIVDKCTHKVSVSSEFLKTIGHTNETGEIVSPFFDILGIRPTDDDFEERIKIFLYEFSDQLFTNKIDRTIWQERFLKDTPPIELAELLGRTREYIDCRYMRTHNKFKAAFKKWYNR